MGAVVWLVETLGLLKMLACPETFGCPEKAGPFSFPIVTCIVISIVLTVLLNVFFWFLEGGQEPSMG